MNKKCHLCGGELICVDCTKDEEEKNNDMYSPSEAKTVDQLCQLQTDHFDSKHYWFMPHDSSNQVTIVKQTSGQSSTQEIQIPRRTFDQMIKWYFRKQKLRKT
jgi:hypothetical protein